MNTKYLLTVSIVCLGGLTACGSSESVAVEPVALQEPSTPAPLPVAPPAQPAAPAEQFVSGQLKEIDVEAKTFVLKDTKGNEHSFVITETTKVTGLTKTQDIRSQEGNNATIRYIEMDSRKSAVLIHVELGS